MHRFLRNILLALLTHQQMGGYDPQAQAQELCIYMWDNYLDISDAKNFIFMSVGDVLGGLTNLLVQRSTSTFSCRETSY